MIVHVRDLKPNPFRNLAHYPLDEAKVECLAQSMRDTTFWDNILARPNGAGFEIAYGHHRLMALRKTRIPTVDIPVRPLTDEQMLKIMANENGEEWGGQAAADLETIRAVRQYLLTHWETLANVTTGTLGAALRKAARSGVGRGRGPGADSIAAFLGGIWTSHKVKIVLDVLVPLEKGDVDEEAIRAIPNTYAAREFVRSARTQPVSIQRAIAAELRDDASKRNHVQDTAARHILQPGRTDPSIKDFAGHLADAAAWARKLQTLIRTRLAPERAVMREHAWSGFAGLLDLHALKVDLDALFSINTREYNALARRHQTPPLSPSSPEEATPHATSAPPPPARPARRRR